MEERKGDRKAKKTFFINGTLPQKRASVIYRFCKCNEPYDNERRRYD